MTEVQEVSFHRQMFKISFLCILKVYLKVLLSAYSSKPPIISKSFKLVEESYLEAFNVSAGVG